MPQPSHLEAVWENHEVMDDIGNRSRNVTLAFQSLRWAFGKENQLVECPVLQRWCIASGRI